MCKIILLVETFFDKANIMFANVKKKRLRNRSQASTFCYFFQTQNTGSWSFYILIQKMKLFTQNCKKHTQYVIKVWRSQNACLFQTVATEEAWQNSFHNAAWNQKLCVCNLTGRLVYLTAKKKTSKSRTRLLLHSLHSSCIGLKLWKTLK